MKNEERRLEPQQWESKEWPKGEEIPGGSVDKESTCYIGDLGSSLGLGRSPEEGMVTHSSILV